MLTLCNVLYPLLCIRSNLIQHNAKVGSHNVYDQIDQVTKGGLLNIK